jgi:hypothetical protein
MGRLPKERTMMKTKAKKRSGWKPVKVEMTVESPTWGDLKKMSERVMELLGGNAAAASKLDSRSFYTLAVLASLNLNESKAGAFLFGKQFLGMD